MGGNACISHACRARAWEMQGGEGKRLLNAKGCMEAKEEMQCVSRGAR